MLYVMYMDQCENMQSVLQSNFVQDGANGSVRGEVNAEFVFGANSSNLFTYSLDMGMKMITHGSGCSGFGVVYVGQISLQI